MLEVRAQNWAVAMRLKMAQDNEFRMPPPGVTENRYTIGGVKHEVFTLRCPTEGCWYMRERIPTREVAQSMLDDHQNPNHAHITVPACPAPPRRESLPSGLTHVQSLWNELDEVVEALSVPVNDYVPYRDMNGVRLKGYAQGIAFSIVLLERGIFPDIEAVSRHARDRRAMRLGAREWEPTPSRWAHDARTVDTQGLHPSADQPAPRPAKRAPAALPTVPKPVKPEWVAAIKAGVGSGMFKPEQMAEAYGLTVAQVNEVLNG